VNLRTRLIRLGDTLSLTLDGPLLEALGIDESTELEVSTDGDVVVITPVRDPERMAKLGRIVAEAHERYAGVFKRLAK